MLMLGGVELGTGAGFKASSIGEAFSALMGGRGWLLPAAAAITASRALFRLGGFEPSPGPCVCGLPTDCSSSLKVPALLLGAGEGLLRLRSGSSR
jgi:hypothetical protein